MFDFGGFIGIGYEGNGSMAPGSGKGAGLLVMLEKFKMVSRVYPSRLRRSLFVMFSAPGALGRRSYAISCSICAMMMLSSRVVLGKTVYACTRRC